MKKLFAFLTTFILFSGTTYAEREHQHGLEEHKMEHTPTADEMKMPK